MYKRQIERAAASGQRDTVKQLRATMDALRFVKKQIAARMEKAEKKRAKAPKRKRAESIKIDLEQLKRRREELRERMQDVDRAKATESIEHDRKQLQRRREELRKRMDEVERAQKESRNFIKRLRVEAPKTVVARDEHVIIVETDKDGKVNRRVIRGDGDDLQRKLQEMVRRARDGRGGHDGRDHDARGHDAHGHDHDEGPHHELAHRVERLQRHVEELTHGMHDLRRQVEELKRANKKLHMHLQGAREPRRVKSPTPPKPPQAPALRLRMGGAGGMGGGPSDARLGRIEELLKKLLELQIKQAKAR